MLTIIVGWDTRERLGLALFNDSLHRYATDVIDMVTLVENELRGAGLYNRPHELRDGRLWCPISDAPMATEFSNSRFLVPWLVRGAEWALFADGADMLMFDDISKLFRRADPTKAVQVVKHDHQPTEVFKMDGQIQTTYERKNWSSLCLWNLHHPANQRLTLEDVNTRPGRDLHRFFWLRDEEIGELPKKWNHLVGVEPNTMADLNGERPALLHYTLGLPLMVGHEKDPWADVWVKELSALQSSARLP